MKRPSQQQVARAPEAWTGVVLAGGRSMRMGRDKATLSWQGRPLLEHMKALLLATGAAQVVVSGEQPDHDGVADPCPRQGPLGGLHGVAQALGDRQLLVVPVDMPALTRDLLARLLDAAPAACVILAGHHLPMRMTLDAASRGLLAEWLQDPSGPRSLRAFQQALHLREIPVAADEMAALANCNTPAEWERLAR